MVKQKERERSWISSQKTKNLKVEDFIAISEGVILLKTTLHSKLYSIKGLLRRHAPTEKAKKAEIRNFYNNLQKDKCTEIMRDMNAKIELPETNEYLTMGKYGERYERGQLFLNFCQQHKLKIANTMFNKPEKLRWT